MSHDVRVRAMSGGYGAVDLFIQCDGCGWSQQLDRFAPTLEDLVRLAADHEAKIRDPFESGEHGVPTGDAA